MKAHRHFIAHNQDMTPQLRIGCKLPKVEFIYINNVLSLFKIWQNDIRDSSDSFDCN
jgi:hypothetical protein